MEDLLGNFSVGGTWSEKAPYPCELSFDFSNGSMTLTGWRESDKGGIFGTWKSAAEGSGSFAFSPSKEGSEAKSKMEEASNKLRKETLTNMGFPDWLITQSLQETSGLEPAINWITRQLEGPSSTNNSTNNGEDVDNSDSIMQLVAMGFDPVQSKEALDKHRGNVERAANWLFDKM
jgi:Holliday junction resolvasome RuvABC DNA-binding subunit